MKVGVMGAGAVGSYFGAKLARAGAEVVLVGRGAHIARVTAQGLRVTSCDGDFRVAPEALTVPSPAGPCDLVLFCVKSPDTAAAAAQLAPLVGSETVLLSLQNGVENDQVLEQAFPGQVLPALCYVGARIDEPGTVVHSAAGRVILGEWDGTESDRARRVARTLEEAGVPAKVSSEIRVELWKKLLWNLAFNTVSALTRATVAEMLGHPGARRVLHLAMDEAVAVAQAAGVPLDEGLPGRVIEGSTAFGPLKTSMLQDVEKARPLEADALNGAVVRLGQQLGIPTPANQTLLGCAQLLSEVNTAGA